MALTIIKEYDAINKYMNHEYRAIYNNNMMGDNFMMADFTKNNIIRITPNFTIIQELLNFYYLHFGHPIGNYYGSIRFMPNCIVERF